MIFTLATHLAFTIVLVSSDNLRQPVLNASTFPYQVLISEQDVKPRCGGAFISEGIILTSASCLLEFGSIKSVCEDAYVYGGGSSLLYVIGIILNAIIHPEYIKDPISYDLAVVKFNPEGKGKQLNATSLNGTWKEDDACIMTSWWTGSETWPEQLTWQAVTPVQCSSDEFSIFCFTDETIVFNKEDYGSPIVCDGVLRGLVPRGGGNTAINLTKDYEWIIDTIKELRKSTIPVMPDSKPEGHTSYYLIEILQKLNNLTTGNKDFPPTDNDPLGHWNNQIVIPLNYVLFAMVIFSFILMFFIIMFTVVLVYYSRK